MNPKRRNQFVLSGRVIHAKSRGGVSGLLVQAWDKDLFFDDCLGEGTTDSTGHFRIAFAGERFREFLFDLRPDVYVKIYSGGVLVKSTENSVILNADVETAMSIEIDESGVLGEASRGRVSGHVRLPDGSFYPAGWVRAFDRDFRKDTLLGEAALDGQGFFRIEYKTESFAGPDKKQPDLIVRVFSAAGEEVAASDVFVRAGPEHVVDLVVGGGDPAPLSEFERISARVAAIAQGVPPSALTPEDVKVLESRAGIPPQRLRFFIQAAKAAEEKRLPPEALYGFFRGGLPRAWPALVAQPSQVLRRTLERALAQNVVSARWATSVESVVDRMAHLLAEERLDVSVRPGEAPLGELLSVSGLRDENKQRELLRLYDDHKGSPKSFWEALGKDPSFRSHVEDLRWTLQLGALTGHHVPLVKDLLRRRAAGEIHALKEMAGWTAADWRERMASSGEKGAIEAPPHAPGATAEEKKENYARLLERMMEDAFPTEAFVQRLKKDDAPDKAGLNQFFARNKNFDFRLHPVERFLTDHPQAMEGIEDHAAVAQDLRIYQRLSRMTPRYSEIQALYNQGLHSSHAVVQWGEDAFVKKMGHPWGASRAREVYESAAQTSALALTQMARWAPAFNISLAVLPYSLAPGEGLPEWESLFGSLDYCLCEHCRSVLSPAAYLVDLLAFLKDRPATTAHRSAKDVLFTRRPDLGQVELTCANTNTLLPYVDLVNEVLEQEVSPVPGVPAQHRQTRSPADVLDANPEYTNPGAYAALRGAVFPWGLPFDLWAEEGRVYLTHLGVARHELMRAFQKRRAADPSEESIAGEALGLTPAQRKIITGAHADSAAPWKFWGYDPAGTWTNDLKSVRTFLDKAGVRYDDLVEWLSLSALNPGGQIRVESSDPQDPLTCDTRKLVFHFPAGMAETFLDRCHRFVRLQRALGWSARALDKTLTALRPAAWNGELIRLLALLVRLKNRFHAPLEHIVAWFSPLDTRPGSGDDAASPSLYEDLFQNKTVIKLNPGEVDPFELRPDRTDLNVIAVGFNARVRAVLAGALNLSGADLSLLIDGPDAVVTAGKELNLENLSRLFRTASMASALNRTIPEFIQLRGLTGLNPFVNGNAAVTSADVERAVAFADKADKIQSVGLTPSALNALLRGVPDPAAPSAEESQTLFLETLRQDLQKIAADLAFPGNAPDRSSEETRKALALILPADQVGKAMSLISGTWTDAPAMNQFIDDYFGAFLTAADAKAKLVGPVPVLTETGARFNYVLPPLLAYLKRVQSENRIVQKMSEGISLDPSVVDGLLRRWISSPADPAQPSLSVFLSPAYAESDPTVPLTAAAFPLVYKTLGRLQKAASVISRFRITADDLAPVFQLSAGTGWIDLNSLPVAAGDPPASFEKWEKLVDLLLWRQDLPGGASDVFEPLARAVAFQPNGNIALANVAKSAILALWSRLSGWPLGELESLLGVSNNAADTGLLDIRFPVQANDPNDYTEVRTWLRISACFALLQRLGASSSQARAWSLEALTEEDARAIKGAAKSKHGEGSWLELAKSLRDPMREKQRQALVHFLLQRAAPGGGRRWKDANDLYAHFLMDVEMSPVMRTSRIKQAAASVQLFVQRCLLNLEPEVRANVSEDAKWREWAWMKNYRVWEANRKVFLWPENWIEPELRDDKSPFFKELENALTQSEITPATAEDAFVAYVEKLDDVARLDVCGVYREREVDDQDRPTADILHVVARTFGAPRAYFYRKRVNDSPWTAWEKIDLDIEGDALIPVVWNRRLFLFWTVISDAVEPKSLTMPGSGQAVQEPRKTWKVRMAWSERKGKAWTPKRMTRQSHTMFWLVTLFSPQDRLVLSSHFLGDDLVILLRMYDNFQGDEVWAKAGVFVFPAEGAEPFFNELWENYDPFDEHVALGYSHGLVPENSEMHRERAVEKAGSHGFSLPSAPVDEAGNVTDVYNAVYVPLLNNTPGTFQVASSRQFNEFTGAASPFFFQDDRRAFLVSADVKEIKTDWAKDDRIDLVLVKEAHSKYAREFSKADDARAEENDETSSPIERRFSLNVSAPGAHTSLLSSEKRLKRLNDGETDPDESMVKEPEEKGSPVDSLTVYQDVYRFRTFYHPFLGPLIKELRREGVEGMLQRPLQMDPHLFQRDPRKFDFDATYDPEPIVDPDAFPQEDMDFTRDGAYALYNWELFFHAPLLIADRLRQNQRFEEALTWFHYIFDPTDTSAEPSPQKYWRTKPFHQTTRADYARQQIQKLFVLLAEGRQDPDLVRQVAEWRQNPFHPHLIARLRPVAYQKHVVMRYLDTLIGWGDQLFRQARDPEQINQATQLYILAADILGRRPDRMKPRVQPPVQTYNSLEPLLDDFSNALVAVEGYLPPPQGGAPLGGGHRPRPAVSLPALLYFCIPKNDKLMSYWDTVEDRLFKIRHGLNMEGKELRLPLFEPPIDPALLVKAAAAGVDIGSALSDMGAPLSPYRFQVMTQKATELCAEVKALGQALLSALEKRDAEGVALIRSGHEIRVLTAARQVKDKQIQESKQTLEGLRKSREAVQVRHDFFATVPFLNPSEKTHLTLSGLSLVLQNVQTGIDYIGNMLSLIPNFKVGAPTSIGLTFGGDNVGQAIKAFSAYLGGQASLLSGSAGLASTMGGHFRRFDDWKLQEKTTARELEQLDRQILAAEIRVAIAEKELENHDLQVQNAKDVDAYLRGKYTNAELYDWMVSQVSSVYFQSYQLAYDVAKRAEKGFRYELGLAESSYIQFGYWDSLKKGLLAGEKLAYDLKRMEASFLDQNRREYELSKTVSLASLDPVAFLTLKQTGVCYVTLPETLFDLDHPGHYMRRLKSVGLTVPCVVGPYSGVHATLTLLSSRVRKSAGAAGAYACAGDDDPRFFHHLGASQSIVTSGGQNDTGLFDGGAREERYLPFEGQGAISQWKLELDKTTNRFDFNTLTDVLLHVKYTARDGGDLLKAAARGAWPAQGVALFSLKHEFPDEWHRFLTPADDAASQSMVIDLRQRFPFQPAGREVRVAEMNLFLKAKTAPPNNVPDVVLELFEDRDGQTPNLLATPAPNSQPIPLVSRPAVGHLHHAQMAWAPAKAPAPWLLRAPGNALPAFLSRTVTVNQVDYKHIDRDKIDDLFLVCRYVPA